MAYYFNLGKVDFNIDVASDRQRKEVNRLLLVSLDERACYSNSSRCPKKLD